MLKGNDVVAGFRIEREIGRGGMGVVYEATQTALGRRVALKVLSPVLSGDAAFAERFRREGTLQASLEHPNVVDVYEAGESEHGLYLAMQLVTGTTLAELLRGGQLDAEQALRLLDEVAHALDAAHATGLVHRDIKPHNVLVDASGHALLADFGLTKMGGGSGVTVTGAVMGTIAYLAPEVVRGDEATSASDRYAFAAMAFECLTGDVVFPRAVDAAVLYAHTTEPPPPLASRRPELPAALDRVFASALAKEPGARPRSAGSIVDGIRDGLGDLVARLGAPPAPAGPQPRVTTEVPASVLRAAGGRRSLVPLVAALLVGLALGAVAVLVAEGDDDASAAAPRAELAPPVARGALGLGSVLGAEGAVRSVDCEGRTPSPRSRDCTVTQAALPGRTVIAPRDGVVTGWTVRGARGELQLQALRERDGKTFQIGASQYEVVNDGDPTHFPANVEVEAGDRFGVLVGGGAAIGIRPTAGATIARFFPPQRGLPHRAPTHPPSPRFAGELLLRVDYVPNGKRRLPKQITGPEARRVPKGKVIARKPLRFDDGRSVELVLVEIDGGLVVDLFRLGQRVARADLEGMRAGGKLVDYYTLNYEGTPAEGEVGVTWANPNSARLVERFYGVHPRDLVFYS